MKNQIFIGLLILTIVTMTACSTTGSKNVPTPTNIELSVDNYSSNVKMFANVDEMKQYLSTIQSNDNSQIRGGIMMDALASKEVAAPTTNGASGADYSSTNIQVQGVDEADFIKNDDKFIYMIANNNLVIINAIGKDSEIISTTTFGESNEYGQPTVRDLYLNGDKLTVIVDKYEKSLYFEKYSIEPIQNYDQKTVVYVYNITDRSAPVVLEEFNISGYYYESRMIGNIVYIITQESLYDYGNYPGPMIAYAKTTIRPNIYYFDNPETNYQLNSVTSIDTDTQSVVDSQSFMLGYGDTIMVSENNIYIAYQKYTPWCWGWRCINTNQDNNRERFLDVIVPLLEGDVKTDVNNILTKHLSQEEEWSQISKIFTELYTKMNDDKSLRNQYNDMFINIEDALNEYDSKKALEDSKTIIHKISIDEGKITYQNKGEVDGRLLNQYSMDEYKGNLRVATSINLWLNKGNVQYNNVYVLNKNMNIVGSLTNLAKNESIYSTRFAGDKLYMVTFRQMDPFFVIDLSNPTTPEVLGYLKIPGYSSYLHPINDSLIIGVGMDTGENQWGGTSTKGVKISLFDVSDFNKPKELDTYIIGLEGSSTPISYDPKAFLYSESKNLLVIPVNEVVDRIKSGDYNYRTKYMNGVYVFNIIDNKFVREGIVTHSTSDTQYYDWYNNAAVTRSLYIDNTLYTISNKYVIASDLSKDLKELTQIDLPQENHPTPIMYENSVAQASVTVN